LSNDDLYFLSSVLPMPNDPWGKKKKTELVSEINRANPHL